MVEPQPVVSPARVASLPPTVTFELPEVMALPAGHGACPPGSVASAGPVTTIKTAARKRRFIGEPFRAREVAFIRGCEVLLFCSGTRGAECTFRVHRQLHRFAAVLGVKRSSYQGPPKTSAPHYDITGFERDRAVRLGAIECSREEIVAIFRRVRVPNGKGRS